MPSAHLRADLAQSALPDVESLRCFAAAAQKLNFRNAARTVGLSPAAFSDRIQKLERLLGTALFDRSTRHVRLTAAGGRLVPQATRCLDEARRCAESVRDTATREPFELVLGTRYELGMSWLLPALADLERARPERRLHCYFADSRELLGQLRRDAIDAFVSSARLTTAGLEYARLHEERYVFVGKQRLLDERPLSRPSHAAGHTLLEVHRDLPLYRYFLDSRSADEVWAFGRVQFLGSIAPVKARVLEGAGVAVLPRYFVERELRAGKLAVVMPKAKLPHDWFRLAWRAGHPHEAALRELGAELARLPLK